MSPVGDPSGHWPAERLSGALDPHKPDRLVELCEPAVSDGFKEDGLVHCCETLLDRHFVLHNRRLRQRTG